MNIKLPTSLAAIVALVFTGCGGSSESQLSVQHLRTEAAASEKLANHYEREWLEHDPKSQRARNLMTLGRLERTHAKLYRQAAAHLKKAEAFCSDPEAIRQSKAGTKYPYAYVVCEGGSAQPTTTQLAPSISQLQHEATAQHEAAENYLHQAEQIVREAKSNEEHARAESLIHLEEAAQRRASVLHGQMCKLVLQIPNVLPGNGHLARTAYMCEQQGFR